MTAAPSIGVTYQVQVINSQKIRSLDTNLASKFLDQINKQNINVEKKNKKIKILKKRIGSFSIFKSVKSLASGKEDVQFPDSPDFENLPDFRTGRDVQ